jgi:two-component system CheB/CheR fusion protein
MACPPYNLRYEHATEDQAMPDPTHEGLLRLLADQAQDHALLLLDPQGLIVGWLAGEETIFGYTAPEMIGQPLHRLFTPEDRQRGVPEHELEVARQDGRAEDDRWQLRKDGTRFWAVGVVTPLRDAAKQLVGFGKVLRDRTDVRAQIEAAAQRAEAATQADRRKTIFLGTLAHELRNPLAPLSAAVQLIHLARGDAAALAYPVQIIERQLAILRRLVDDLLDVTRIEEGKIRLQRGPTDLNEVLRRAAEACRPAAEQRHHDFRVLLLPGATVVDGDPERLQQVFVNLLNNAVKYTPDGGSLWLKQTVEGPEAVVRVQDTGVGIEPGMLPRIFELFTQEESSLARAEGGLGLGLPLVRQLVSLHGGTVQVRSEGKSKGSEFTVRLPLLQQGAPLEESAPPPEGR